MNRCTFEPTDNSARLFPVSIKGVVIVGGRVALLKNERDEWELPGGKLEVGERPTECVIREINEELGLTATIDSILDAWVYNILGKVDVLIVTYGCHPIDAEPITMSNEHKAVGLFWPSEIEGLCMPAGYKTSIRVFLTKVSEQRASWDK